MATLNPSSTHWHLPPKRAMCNNKSLPNHIAETLIGMHVRDTVTLGLQTFAQLPAEDILTVQYHGQMPTFRVIAV